MLIIGIVPYQYIHLYYFIVEWEKMLPLKKYENFA